MTDQPAWLADVVRALDFGWDYTRASLKDYIVDTLVHYQGEIRSGVKGHTQTMTIAFDRCPTCGYSQGEQRDATRAEVDRLAQERDDAIHILVRLLYDFAPHDCSQDYDPCPSNCAWQAARAFVGEKLDAYREAFERGDDREVGQ